MEATYKVDGMTCGGCASSVTKAIQRLSPALEVEVILDAGWVLVKGAHEESAVKDAVEGAGFDFAGTAS
jgi:copper chaperone